MFLLRLVLSVISELPSWLSNIWNEIQEWHIKNTSSNVEPYRVDSSSLELYANFQDTLLYWFISKIIPMGVNIKEESKLLTLFSQANAVLLYKELRAPRATVFQNKESKGLVWVVTMFNRTLPKASKIPIITTAPSDNNPFLITPFKNKS
ncbi:hypothetical protein [Shewanella sp. 125m-1]